MVKIPEKIVVIGEESDTYDQNMPNLTERMSSQFSPVVAGFLRIQPIEVLASHSLNFEKFRYGTGTLPSG